MMYNDDISVPYKTSLIGLLERKLERTLFFLLRPFDNNFLMLVPLFYYWRGEMRDYKKYNLDFEKLGGPGMCSTEHTKF